jgi:CDP-Glycerol:Poly(glycerophosphate) glycerophosphotransferase
VSLFARRAGRKAFDKTDPATRAITFYAEDGDSWPHFEPIVRELVGPLGRDLCYLTSSKDDPVLELEDPHIHAFEIGEGFKRTYLFQTLEVGVLVATVPQLGIPLLPRSKRAAALGTDYVYVFHSMASTHMIYEPDGFDHYDTVCCVGPYMVDEIRKREALHGLDVKQLVEHGYGRLDAILDANASAGTRAVCDPPVVLIAPSWGPQCLLETCGREVVQVLLDSGAEVILRPHPMTNRKSPDVVPALVKEFSSHPRFAHDADLVSQASLHRSDLMVSDWSGAALEYAFGLERPVLFVDVPRKVNNPDYPELGIEPFEATVREEIGRLVAPDRLDRIPALVADLVADRDAFVDGIRATRDKNVFNVGHSGPVAAELIAEKASAYLARVGG